MGPQWLARGVLAYRVMAWLTGTILIALFFVGIPLQLFAHSLFVVRYVGTVHGILYIVYLVVAFVMTRLVRIKITSPAMIIVLAAGTVPVATFVVERWITRRYIDPALAAAGLEPRGGLRLATGPKTDAGTTARPAAPPAAPSARQRQ